MAINRYREFINFAEKGKGCKHGSLVMKGDQVWSYAVVIATVDREDRTIEFNEERYSRTTNCHQSAVRLGSSYLSKDGWNLIHI